MRFIFYCYLFLIVSSCSVKSKSINPEDTYFVKNKMYHYNTLYIDINGDTIIKGKMTIKPLDKFWIAQRGLQESVNYIHINDTAEFNKYKDPDLDFFKHQQKYFYKHGKLKMYNTENTGGYLLDSMFYLHPPRTNQFRMLFYTGHLFVNYRFLSDRSFLFGSKLRLYGIGTITTKQIITPLKKSSLQSIENGIKVWGIKMRSHGQFTNDNYKKDSTMYNSKLDAEFCKEYGFIKMNYTFDNGIKIQFNFNKMTKE